MLFGYSFLGKGNCWFYIRFWGGIFFVVVSVMLVRMSWCKFVFYKLRDGIGLIFVLEVGLLEWIYR